VSVIINKSNKAYIYKEVVSEGGFVELTKVEVDLEEFEDIKSENIWAFEEGEKLLAEEAKGLTEESLDKFVEFEGSSPEHFKSYEDSYRPDCIFGKPIHGNYREVFSSLFSSEEDKLTFLKDMVGEGSWKPAVVKNGKFNDAYVINIDSSRKMIAVEGLEDPDEALNRAIERAASLNLSQRSYDIDKWQELVTSKGLLKLFIDGKQVGSNMAFCEKKLFQLSSHTDKTFLVESEQDGVDIRIEISFEKAAIFGVPRARIESVDLSEDFAEMIRQTSFSEALIGEKNESRD